MNVDAPDAFALGDWQLGEELLCLSPWAEEPGTLPAESQSVDSKDSSNAPSSVCTPTLALSAPPAPGATTDARALGPRQSPGTAADARGDTSGGREEHGSKVAESPAAGKGTPEARKSTRKERVAAACRRFRARRREEIQELKRKNCELELEREEFLERIALLQTETQTLRSHGAVDLERENELLRSEVRLHKRFIAAIVSSTNEASKLTWEERVRFLRAGLGAATGQALGMCYTSVADPSWKVASPQFVLGRQLHVRAQLLPLGSCPLTFKRINFRVEYLHPHETASDVAERVHSFFGDSERLVEGLKQQFPSQMELANLTIKKIDLGIDPADLSVDQVSLLHTCKRDADPERVPVDVVSLLCRKTTTICPSAILLEVCPELLSELEPSHSLSAHFIVAATSEKLQDHVRDLQPLEKDVERLNKPFHKSLAFTDLPGGGVVVTQVCSIPRDDNFTADDVQDFLPVIRPDGSLPAKFVASLAPLVTTVDGQFPLGTVAGKVSAT